jgi:hypothetical protein
VVVISENVDTVKLGHELSFMAAWSETQTRLQTCGTFSSDVQAAFGDARCSAVGVLGS